jgi:hypothetical protein
MYNYGKTSPYANTGVVNGYLDILNFTDIPAQADDIQFTLTSLYMHRPDLLANDIYGDSTLWWVFAVRNKDVIRDSVYDFIPGQTIYLPKLETIRTAIGG